MRRIATLTMLMVLATGFQGRAQAEGSGGPVAFVAAWRGDVSVVRDGQPLQVQIGLQIVEGDILRCGPKGRLKVLFTDDAVLALGSNSEIVVSRYVFAPKANQRMSRIGLLSGTVRVLVQKLVAGEPADFKVTTSSAVAGVRGTEFVLVAQEDRTRLYTLSGEVELQSGDRQGVLVAAGMGSQVGSDGLASEAVAVAGELLTVLRNETDTKQNPTALAWSVHVAPEDKIKASGNFSGSEDRSGADLDIEPCSNCQDWSPIGGDRVSGHNSFTSNNTSEDGIDFIGELDGAWKIQEPELDIDPAGIHPVTLRIHVHR